MAAIPWGSPSMKKTKGKSQSPSAPCRYLIPGHVGAPAPSAPTQPLLFPRGHVRVLPAFPTTQCLPAIFHCLAGAVGGREGRGCFCLLPLHPCHQPRRVPKSPVLDPALNGKLPGVMLQAQAQCLQISKTV